MPTKHSLKTNLYEHNIWQEISPQKKIKQYFYHKITPTEFSTKKAFKKHVSRTKDFEEKSLPKSLPRDIFLAKRLWKNEQRIFEETLSTEKSERNYLPQNPLKRNLHHSLERNPYQTNFRRNIYQRIFEEQRLQKNNEDKSLRTLFLETFLQKIEDASPPKNRNKS